MDETLTLKSFLDAWELFREPALAGCLAGGLLGYLGVYIVLRRMVFLSAALSQCAGLGVTLAFFLDHFFPALAVVVTPLVGATSLTIVVALLLTLESSVVASRRDSLLGLTYLAGSAGSLAIGTRIVEESHDISAVLFGSAVMVLPEDFRQLLWMTGGLFLLHLWWRRGFTLISFDPEGARVRRIPVRFLNITLLVTLAVAISICTRVLGALPVFAFSVLPAMAAVRVAANIPRALAIATLLGAASGLGGYVLAYLYQLPVGASQALLAAAFALLAYLYQGLIGVRLQALHGPGASPTPTR